MMIKTFDLRRDLVIPGNQQAAILFNIHHFLDIAQKAIQKKGSFHVALAGGSTPKAIYQGLASPENKGKLDWNRVFLFWSDERCVPKNHPDSNYKMAMDAGIDQLGIPEANIFPMPSEGDLEKGAAEYEKCILKKIPNRSFDLLLLGMGEDGHTASLFPKTHALHTTGRLVVPNFIPDKDTWRMTLTFDCINAAFHPTVSALGKSKANKVKEVLMGPYEPDILPAQRVGSEVHRALWILDNAAASEL
jgi:6-phosphogluconolactonase